MRMTRYHLNVFNDIVTRDEEGLDLSGLAAAVEYAIKGARELIASDVIEGKSIHQSHRVEITDDAGALLHTIRFGDMIRLEP